MEARLVEALPREAGWQFEPKWDGFRCLVFRDGSEVELKAKSGKSLNRFFPDAVRTFAALPMKKLVLDGELLISVGGEFSFDALQMRLHPAASRVAKLSAEQPATFVAFDCLIDARAKRLEVSRWRSPRIVPATDWETRRPRRPARGCWLRPAIFGCEAWRTPCR